MSEKSDGDRADRSEAIAAVGILHSLTGTMAIGEVSLRNAALMAIAEINQAGGVLGRRIEPIFADGESDPKVFARQAKHLLQERQVKAIFGCWTSNCRKAVLPIVEELNALLWYPLQYEGLEASSNIFYTGSCPNQQIEPAVNWLLENHGNRFYLIGSDYVFPRTVNQIIKSQLKRDYGACLAEQYVPMGATDFSSILTFIQHVEPDIIFNTLNGDSNIAFYQQYQAAGISSQEIPIMASSLAEEEVRQIGKAAVGHYAAWHYFQTLETPANQTFVRNFKARYGSDAVTSAPIEAAYTQVYLWKQAVEKANSFESDRVRQASYGLMFEAPGGRVRIEKNHHLCKPCRIGQVLPSGQFEIVWESESEIAPQPWLGVEAWQDPARLPIVDLLGQVSQGIQDRCQLEENTRAMKALMVELIASNKQLRKTQKQLLAAEARFRDLQGREELLKQRLASQIRNSLESETILAIAVEEIHNLLEVNCCQFWWYRASQSSHPFEIAACDGSPPSFCSTHRSAVVELIGDRILRQSLFRINDLAADTQLDRTRRQSLQALGLRAILAVPIRTRSGQTGIIVCEEYQKSRNWTDREIELLDAVAIQIAIAVEQAQLYGQSQQSAAIAQARASELEQALKNLKQTQAQLIQTEKMSALGMSIAGVAHEIKNPVGFICGNLGYAQEYANSLLELIRLYQKHYPQCPPEIQDYAEEIELDFLIDDFPKTLASMEVGAERIQKLVLSLRNFSRRDEKQMEATDLHEGIESTLLILNNRLKAAEIELLKDYGTLPPVECYPSQMNQVFMNLLGNAIDVLEEMSDRPKRIIIRTEMADATATIRIIDSGTGMPSEVRQQLFEPFFTTKPIGKGTGLGLAISHKIVVERHGGKLDCVSTFGEGTEFIVKLPLSHSSPDTVEPHLAEQNG